jgi:hypothetical protein
VNGKSVGAGDNFGRTYVMNIAAPLHPGTNLLAVEAVNGADRPNPAGLIASLSIRYQDGRQLNVDTDSQWQSATAARSDWRSALDADAAWRPAIELGSLGMAPWGDIEQNTGVTDIFPDITRIGDWLTTSGLAPDFAYQTHSGSAALRYIHRRTADRDIYFVANKTPELQQALCTFRVTGRTPELWWPDSGQRERLAAFAAGDGRTQFPLRLGPVGSVFVVFESQPEPSADPILTIIRNGTTTMSTTEPLDSEAITVRRAADGVVEAVVRQPGSYRMVSGTGKVWTLDVPSVPEPLPLTGSWQLTLSPTGVPQAYSLSRLISWSELNDREGMYYAGPGIYRKTFSIPPEYTVAPMRLTLDLGNVQVISQVKLNGRDCGIQWKTPYEVDITDTARSGENQLEIWVANLWINRMIGDEQLPEDSDRNPNGTLKAWPAWLEQGLPSPTGRQTMTSWRLWPKDSPLQPSGLLGPVVIKASVLLRPKPE